MLLDVTLKVTPQMIIDAQGSEKKSLVGHLGTHFDVMNQEFPLEYTKRKGLIFDIRHIQDRDVQLADIDISKVEADMFVAFFSGYVDKVGYGSKTYFSEHPQLANELIEALLEKQISIIGLDFAGIRRGKEHTPTDQYCANQGIFIVENLCNLKTLLHKPVTFHTYPMNFTDMTGLPCRVVAEY